MTTRYFTYTIRSAAGQPLAEAECMLELEPSSLTYVPFGPVDVVGITIDFAGSSHSIDRADPLFKRIAETALADDAWRTEAEDDVSDAFRPIRGGQYA